MHITKRSLVTKTIHVGLSTVASKALGMVRLLLEAQYLGVNFIADAYFTAFRIPNSLRKIFAEGALTAAFVPTMIGVLKKEDREQASKLVTALFCCTQGFLLLMCIAIACNSTFVVKFLMPGWSTAHDGAKITAAISFLQILIYFIVFMSSSALLAGALQAIHHFGIPANAQIIINGIWIAQIYFCMYYQLPAHYLAIGMLLNGAFFLLIHLGAFYYYGFRFAKPDASTWHHFYEVLKKFLPCIISMGAVEINLFIDQTLTSYLPEGSASLLYYITGFIRVPLAVFATSFSTILLPHFARVHTYAPRRLNYYLLESSKLVFWVTIPLSLCMAFFAHKALGTFLLSDKFSLVQVDQGAQLLIVFAATLFFFSFNRILLNIYYAVHETTLPTVITVITTVINTVLNILLMQHFLVLGLVIATCTAEIIKTGLLLYMLKKRYHFHLYGWRFSQFAGRYLVQLLLLSILFYSSWRMIIFGLEYYLPAYVHLLVNSFLYWFWVCPLVGIVLLALYITKDRFGIKLHFVE